MRREEIGIGSTCEEARANAIKKLGINPDEAEIDLITEIIDQPEKKVLGLFGGKPAKVLVYYEISPAKPAYEYLKGLIEGIGAKDVQIKIEERENSAVFTLEGEGLGIIIGRRGETLDAIQYLVGLFANRVNSSYYKISINTGNYREKREGIIESVAKKTALRAIRIGKNIAFEPMNPYERRIIHTVVQELDGASSWSVGDGNQRHVVVGPAGKNEGEEGESFAKINQESRYSSNNRNNSRGYGNNRSGNRRSNYRPRKEYNDGYNKGGSDHKNNNNFESKSEIGAITDVERRPSRSDVSAPLYGKIEPKIKQD